MPLWHPIISRDEVVSRGEVVSESESAVSRQPSDGRRDTRRARWACIHEVYGVRANVVGTGGRFPVKGAVWTTDGVGAGHSRSAEMPYTIRADSIRNEILSGRGVIELKHRKRCPIDRRQCVHANECTKSWIWSGRGRTCGRAERSHQCQRRRKRWPRNLHDISGKGYARSVAPVVERPITM